MRPGKRLILLIAIVLTVAACDGPALPIPPTPTPGSVLASSDGHNHQHGEGGPQARLITRYGGPIKVSVTTEPSAPQPGQPVEITYSLTGADGKPVPVDKLAVTHERPMHLIIVSRDLGYFSHVHPEPAGDGLYKVRETLPGPGPYLLFNEFYSVDGTVQLERDVLTAGETGKAPTSDESPVLPVTLGQTEQVEGLSAALTTNARRVRRRVPVLFNLGVEKDGKPFTAMEPFLGAPAHVVVVSADTKQFAHTHADLPGGAMSHDMSGVDMSKMVMPTPPAVFGPDVQFTHTFMQPGLYRVWVQFGHSGGQAATFGYNLEVVR